MSDIQTLYDAGAHFALPRTRRHPSAAPYLFGTKDRTDIFNLEETGASPRGGRCIRTLTCRGSDALRWRQHEVAEIVKAAAQASGSPYVAGRWIGEP